MSKKYVESADYAVSVTIHFSTVVSFAPIERDSPITPEDALSNFYGYGLSELFDSGEYGYDVDASSIRITRVDQ